MQDFQSTKESSQSNFRVQIEQSFDKTWRFERSDTGSPALWGSQSASFYTLCRPQKQAGFYQNLLLQCRSTHVKSPLPDTCGTVTPPSCSWSKVTRNLSPNTSPWTINISKLGWNPYSQTLVFTINQWEFQDPKLEVPTICKAYFLGLWPYGWEYLQKI